MQCCQIVKYIKALFSISRFWLANYCFVAGYLGGVFAMFISGVILDKLLACFTFDDPLLKYKCYFAMAAIIITPGVWLLARLRKD